jgi:RNA polymerase sigma-70 factor (ECF subfamily)
LAWSAFVERYGPHIYRWCRRWRLQDADAQDVTQDVLTLLVRKLRTFAYDPSRGTFRGWLKTLTYHAWCDYLERQGPGQGTGDSAILERLRSIEAREDLQEALASTYDLELLAEAEARVQLRVTPRDWKIYKDLTSGGRSGPAVAQELRMRVTAVLMAKSNVLKKVREEIHRLGGLGSEAREGEA